MYSLNVFEYLYYIKVLMVPMVKLDFQASQDYKVGKVLVGSEDLKDQKGIQEL